MKDLPYPNMVIKIGKPPEKLQVQEQGQDQSPERLRINKKILAVNRDIP